MRYFLLFLSHTAVALAAIFLLLPEDSPQGPVLPTTAADQPRAKSPGTPITEQAPTTPGSIESQTTIFRAQLVAHQLAAASDVNEVETYLDSYVSHRDIFYSKVVALIFLERLIELDPETAVRYAESARVDYSTRQNLLGSIVTTWVRHDEAAAIEYFLSINNAETRNAIGARLLMDPMFASSSHAAEVRAALGQYGRSLTAAARRNQLSPEAAFDAALGLSDGQRRSSLMTAVSRWSQVDPAAAMNRIANLTNPSEKQMAMQMLISQVSRHDAFQAYDLLQTHSPGDSTLLANVIPMMMSQDPERGLPYLRSFTTTSTNIHVVANAVTQWAARDITAAIAFAETLEGGLRDQTLTNLTMTYLQTDADAAMRWVSTLNNAHARTRALSMLPQYDLALAETWLTRIDSSDPAASNLLANIARQKATAGMESAMTWLADYRDEPGYPAAISNVLAQHTHVDPEGAAEYLDGLASNRAYSAAFQQLAAGWSANDPDAAVEWVNSLPPGDNRQDALSAVVMNLAHQDRDRAIALVAGVDGRRGDQLRIQLAHMLTAQNPTEAASIATRLGLTEEEAAAIQQNFPGGRMMNQVMGNIDG